MTQPAQTPPPFDPNAAHQQRPRLRPVRAFAAQLGEHPALGLADARQISDKVVFTMPAAQFILPLLDGQKSLDEIVTAVGRGLTRPILEGLVAQLDDAGLLFGPRYEALLEKVRADFESSDTLPPGSTAQFAEMLADQALRERGKEQGLPEGQIPEVSIEERETLGNDRMRQIFDEFIAQALKDVPNPSLDTLPKAVIVPHIDYARGWMNYAHVWGRLRVANRPDRVVILGTNHFGEATGVCGCDKGYQSPFGVCPLDTQLLDRLKAELGPADSEKLLRNKYDHEREHSIDLQIPWIQHVLGADDQGQFCKVLGVLVHDPAVNNGESYDGQGLGLEPFIAALGRALAAMPGTTLLVSSADLSHVGPAFGDQQPMHAEGEHAQAAEEARNKVFMHDRDMLRFVAENKPEELVSSMAWQQNPTRWCSTGNIVATMRLARPAKVEILNYAAALDPQSFSLVSNVAVAMS